MSENKKNIIDPNEYQRRVLERRVKWSQEYPDLAPEKHRRDESMKDAYSTLSLRRSLFRYMTEIHPNDEFSDEVVRQYRRIDPKVRILTDEIDKRMEEDNELANLGLDQESIQKQEREETGRIVKKELENAIGDVEYGKNPSLLLIDKQALDEEGEIANNPARVYEQSMTQQLQRQMGRELKRAFDPNRTRPQREEDTISEELDVKPVQKTPTGRYHDVVASSEAEIRAAIERLLPIDNHIIIERHREEFDRYLAKKLGEVYES
jgi:predicted transcriptional regulator with HTH domain